MLRCVLPLLTAVAVVTSPAVHAQAVQARTFGADALRGEIIVTQPPEILLNGQASRLAPGARIRGMDNLLVMSGSVVGVKMWVHYTVDQLGQPRDIWVLTPEEAARKPWPTTLQQAQTWRFDAASQTWTQP